MKIIHIVAMDRNGCIGVGDNLPWHIPSDLQYFKENTLGKAVLVGNNTYKALPAVVSEGRTLYKVSRSKGDQLTLENLEGLRSFTSASTDLMIAGGAEVYAQTLHLADELLITEVDLAVNGDKYYPPFLDTFVKVYSSPTHHENGIDFRFTKWVPKLNDEKPE